MTATLPFIVQPKTENATIGDDKIGTLEIPKLYSLSNEEEDFISKYSADILSNAELAISMAAAITCKLNQESPGDSGASSNPPQEYKIIDTGNALLRGDFDFFKNHLEEIFNFNKQTAENFKQKKLITATAVIKYRLVSDWTIEDTKKINPLLIEKIADFAMNEQFNWRNEEVTE